MSNEALQLGGIFAICMALIELLKFGINKWSSTGKVEKTADDKLIFDKLTAQIEILGTNHMTHIEAAINTGNDRLVDAIQAMHIDLIKELSKRQ